MSLIIIEIQKYAKQTCQKVKLPKSIPFPNITTHIGNEHYLLTANSTPKYHLESIQANIKAAPSKVNAMKYRQCACGG